MTTAQLEVKEMVETKQPEVKTGLKESPSESIEKIIDDYDKLRVICSVTDFRISSSKEKVGSDANTSLILFKETKVLTDILNPERRLRSIGDLFEYLLDFSKKGDFKTIADISDFSSYSPKSIRATLAKLFSQMKFNVPYYFKYGNYIVFALKSEALGYFVYHTPISEVRKIRAGSMVLEPMVQTSKVRKVRVPLNGMIQN